jgi:hypothetical protein
MFNRFDVWRYTDDSNCWDLVRQWLVGVGVPECDVPKYGIIPSNKKAMTKAANDVKTNFVDCGPVQNAIACHYRGRTILHVGIVDGGMVRHTSRSGTMKTKICEFERQAKTIYKIHKSLCI